MTAPRHRLEMCRLAVEGFTHIKASSLEINNKFDGKAYDFVTKFLPTSFPKKKYRFSFIIGMDNALKINKWYCSKELRKEISFIVFPRYGQVKCPVNPWFDAPNHTYLPIPAPDISSTQVRNWIKKYQKNGVELSAPYMNKKVLNYIKEYGLYDLGEK